MSFPPCRVRSTNSGCERRYELGDPLVDSYLAFELRSNVTADADAYVALAERLGCSLLTADQRLAATPMVACADDVLSP